MLEHHALICFFFFCIDTTTTEIYTLSLHDALPISPTRRRSWGSPTPATSCARTTCRCGTRSEEHTSELQSRRDLVCRLLLEKKKKHQSQNYHHSTDSPQKK